MNKSIAIVSFITVFMASTSPAQAQKKFDCFENGEKETVFMESMNFVNSSYIWYTLDEVIHGAKIYRNKVSNETEVTVRSASSGKTLLYIGILHTGHQDTNKHILIAGKCALSISWSKDQVTGEDFFEPVVFHSGNQAILFDQIPAPENKTDLFYSFGYHNGTFSLIRSGYPYELHADGTYNATE